MDRRVIQGAVIGALLAGLCEQLYAGGLPLTFVARMPLYQYGFGWVLPAAAAGVIGGLVGRIIQPEEDRPGADKS